MTDPDQKPDNGEGCVRTVLGDVSSTTLGVTYLHEHLVIDSPLVHDRFPHIWLPSADEATAEVRECVAAGVGTMVDTMPGAAGRNVVKLAEVSRRTGVHVVATTGLHTAKYYDGRPWTQHEDEQVLAEFFTSDIVEGVDRYEWGGPVVRRTPHRAGVVKAATGGEQPTPAERRAFAAAVQTARSTGAPLLTHCEEGRGAVAQLELLRALDMPLHRVVLSHTDKVRDIGYHRELLQSGVNLEYDQGLRQPVDEQDGTARLLTQVLGDHAHQLMLGTDGARRSLWRTLGGAPGLAWLAGGFVDVLSAWGVDELTRRRLLVDNPARLLSLARPPDPMPAQTRLLPT